MLYAHPHRPLVLAALVMILAVADVDGATFHVAMSGDDAAVGTAAAPWRTIHKAVAIARAGDTVVVHGGVYTGHVILRHSGEPDKPIVLRTAPGLLSQSNSTSGCNLARRPWTREPRRVHPQPI